MARQQRDINGDDGIYVLYMAVIVAVLTMYGMSTL